MVVEIEKTIETREQRDRGITLETVTGTEILGDVEVPPVEELTDLVGTIDRTTDLGGHDRLVPKDVAVPVLPREDRDHLHIGRVRVVELRLLQEQ